MMCECLQSEVILTSICVDEVWRICSVMEFATTVLDPISACTYNQAAFNLLVDYQIKSQQEKHSNTLPMSL